MDIKTKWKTFLANEKLKNTLYDIIFQSDTPKGKIFDVTLMVCIIVSILITIFDSLFTSPYLVVPLVILEYLLTIFFTLEYLARLYCSPNRKAYVLSFFGIIDLISILPMYLGFFLHSARFMIVLRSIRLIRVFRIFKLFSFIDEGYALLRSISQSMRKLLVFFLFVLILNICIGTLMYMVEGNLPDTAFTSIPRSIYWSIVTMTTVGYGDITPTTGLGQILSSVVMLLGYTIIAVPTGIVSSTMVENRYKAANRACPNCGRTGHELNSKFCRFCGSELETDK